MFVNAERMQKSSKFFSEKMKKGVDNGNGFCYNTKAVARESTREQGSGSEHLENYIVQENKNKPKTPVERGAKANLKTERNNFEKQAKVVSERSE